MTCANSGEPGSPHTAQRGRASNKIEHRLFSHIGMNWRGRPLSSHEAVVELTAATATKSGPRVGAALDRD
jgi:hypothetical protein